VFCIVWRFIGVSVAPPNYPTKPNFKNIIYFSRWHILTSIDDQIKMSCEHIFELRFCKMQGQEAPCLSSMFSHTIACLYHLKILWQLFSATFNAELDHNLVTRLHVKEGSKTFYYIRTLKRVNRYNWTFHFHFINNMIPIIMGGHNKYPSEGALAMDVEPSISVRN